MTAYPHRVRYAIGNEGEWRDFPEVDRYDISSDMLDPSDQVSLVLPWSVETWGLCSPDNQINIWIDEQRVFSGIIDERVRELSRGTSTVTITARDKVGRLVDESAPLFRFEGLGIVDLAKKLAGNLLQVITSNAGNRRLITGRGKNVTREPPIATGASSKRKVDPGDTKWQVLQYFLEESNLLAWATADGKSLVIGRPNYQQPAQWYFTVASDDALWGTTDILSYSRRDSLGERYSAITVVGSKRGSDIEGEEPTRQRGTVKNGPNKDGTGKDFRIAKRLLVQDDRVRTGKAVDRATREMAERDGAGRGIRITAQGHGQIITGGTGAPALYACDTIADIDDRDIGDRSSWYVTAVRYSGGKDQGPSTDLTLVPIGTDLRMT